jgi:hypothetical protein
MFFNLFLEVKAMEEYLSPKNIATLFASISLGFSLWGHYHQDKINKENQEEGIVAALIEAQKQRLIYDHDFQRVKDEALAKLQHR